MSNKTNRENDKELFELHSAIKDNIVYKNVEELLKENMTDYYKEILCYRGIPDFRDGLIEVQRRILWTCHTHNWVYEKNHVKFAKINGNTLTYHPHSIASVYDAATGMGQEWKSNITLIDIYGNRGNINGDVQGADRYVEGRLHKNAQKLLLQDLKNNSIDYVNNYDNSEKEPFYLNSRLPMVLINGAFGIAAGYATSIMPHNPGEVIDQFIKYIDDNEHVIDLMPDFPTGGIIINSDEVKEGYNKEKSQVRVRARIQQDENKHLLIMTEIPYMKTVNKLKQEIIECTKESTSKDGKKQPPLIPGIKNMHDDTRNNKVRLVIEIKKDYDLDLVESQLYKYTNCETTLSSMFLTTFNRNFMQYFKIKDFFRDWLDYRRTTIKRIKNNSIKDYKYQSHLLEGKIKVLDSKNIDKLFSILKNGNGKKDIKEKLMNEFNLTDIQSEVIANEQAYKLNNTNMLDLINKLNEYKELINNEIEFFKNQNLIDELIKEDLISLKKIYKRERKTECINVIKNDSDTIPNTEHLIVVTKNGYVKKIDGIDSQKRGGKGINVGKIKDGDIAKFIMNVMNKDILLIFTENGKVYKLNISDIKENSNLKSYGTQISYLIENQKISSVLSITPNELENSNCKLVIATKYNKIKLVDIKEFQNIRQNGIISTKLEENDKVIYVEKVENENSTVIATTNTGSAINMNLSEIPNVGRVSYGSILFSNKIFEDKNVHVSDVSVVNDEQLMFLINSEGKGKIIEISEFPCKSRGIKGMMNCKLNDGIEVVKFIPCNEDDVINIMSNKSLIALRVSDIPKTLRPTYGSIIKKLEDNEYIIDACIL